jgi:hypothetical protein
MIRISYDTNYLPHNPIGGGGRSETGSVAGDTPKINVGEIKPKKQAKPPLTLPGGMGWI